MSVWCICIQFLLWYCLFLRMANKYSQQNKPRALYQKLLVTLYALLWIDIRSAFKDCWYFISSKIYLESISVQVSSFISVVMISETNLMEIAYRLCPNWAFSWSYLRFSLHLSGMHSNALEWERSTLVWVAEKRFSCSLVNYIHNLVSPTPFPRFVGLWTFFVIYFL